MEDIMARRSGKFYSKNEKETLKRFGLTPCLMSGAGNLEKEDGYNDNLLCQHKSTDAASYSIKLNDIRKLELHAAIDHKTPFFMVQFLENDDIFFIMRPEHVEDIWKYLMSGESLPETKSEPQNDIIDIEEMNTKSKRMIKSGNKDKYKKMIEKELKERNDKFETSRRNIKKANSK